MKGFLSKFYNMIKKFLDCCVKEEEIIVKKQQVKEKE
jgi:hypothetical protein